MPSDVRQVVGHRERESGMEDRERTGRGQGEDSEAWALTSRCALKRFWSTSHTFTLTLTHTHPVAHTLTHTCKTIKCAYKIFNASKNAGKCQKMPEKSKAIPSRFPLREKNIYSVDFRLLWTPPTTWRSGTFIVLVVLIFLFVCCCFPFFVASHIRNRIRVRQLPAQCSPLDWVNK